MAHQLRDLGEVEKLLIYFAIMLEPPLPPFVSDEDAARIEFAQHLVLWILRDPRGDIFGDLVAAWRAGFEQLDAEDKHRRN